MDGALCSTIDVDAAGVRETARAEISTPEVVAADNAYRGAEMNRLWKGWMPGHRSGDSAIVQDYPLLTARMRDLFRNDPVMRKLKREMCKHVVSANGIQTFADVLKTDGALGEQDPDDEFNFESDELFERWAEEEADYEGKFTWAQMQWQMFAEVIESGGCLLLECADNSPDRVVPLCYQLIEYEQLDTSVDRVAGADGNRVVRGIEFDRRNRPVAYYLFDAHPFDTASGFSWKSTRVPASRVIHCYFPNRPSENIGVSLFSGNVQSARDLDWYLGNELTAAALGALLTLIVKRKNNTGSGLGLAGDATSTSGSSDDNGNPLVKMSRGAVSYIGVDDSIEIAESKRPSRDAGPFIELILMMQGMAAGLSQARVTGNYKGTSYTAARAMHLDDQAFFVVLQGMCGRDFVAPVRKRFTLQAAGYGRFQSINVRQFRNRRWEMLRLLTQAPGREQLDPEKETGSAMERIKAGFSTWQDECGLRGKNWRRVALQQKRERKFFEKHQLDFDLEHSAAFLARRAAPVEQEETE